MMLRPSAPVSVLPWGSLARMNVFWIGAAGIAVFALMINQGFLDLPGFLLIALSSLLPAFLWCRRAAHGIPIYPIFALGTLWTFGFPLLQHSPLILQYGPGERLSAAAIIALTNLIGTAAWYLLARTIAPPPAAYFGFRFGGDLLFFGSLVALIVFNGVTSSVDLGMDPALFSVVRAIVQALANLGLFVLGYRLGQRQLGGARAVTYCGLLLLLILSTLSSVLMVNALSAGALALIAFALGRGRLPFLALLLFLGGALFLQAGKSAIREKYWSFAEGAPIAFSQYAGFLGDWIDFSTQQLLSGGKPGLGSAVLMDDANAPQSLTERASLLPLFLRVQEMSPSEVPYLSGETYAIIPRLLVPRLFNAEKARTHLGTYLLAIHYDLQRPEDTSMTTIGFGLVNEALANFGYAGCAGLGVLLGLFYGWAGHWSSAHPLLSFRSLFSILILTVAVQNEFTAGVYVTVLFQGACALLLLSLLTMRRIVVGGTTPLPHPNAPAFHPVTPEPLISHG